jgi:SAM-dependent methyltransferase
VIADRCQVFSTFRDPAGSLRIEKGRVLRMVQPKYAAAAQAFLQSKTASEWVDAGWMVSSRMLGVRADGALEMEHDRIFFPSYPWEWCIEQWASAAILTLDLCEKLVAQGLILKDATPLNILFSGTQPVLVDVLSIETREPTNPLWNAYGQFMRTFILPMIALKYLGWPLKASCFRRDGYEPGTLYPALSWAQRLRSPIWSTVALPVLLENTSRKNPARSTLRLSADAAEDVLLRRLRKLKRVVRKLQPEKEHSRWSDYQETAQHYSGDDHRRKEAFVVKAMGIARPDTVLDIGANTGTYSRLAASCGARVVALDTDAAATSLNFERAREHGDSILALHADIARPTPAEGWRNRESLSLLERCAQHFDCVMLLGVLHHLVVTDQIPLAEIARLLSDLGPRWLVVEWIPPSDEKFKEICRGRDDLYGQLRESDLTAAFEPYFQCGLREQLDNGRSLLLLEAR